MNKMFILIMAFFSITATYSQKTPVAIFPFVSALPENKARASEIQQIVIEILRNKSDIELIDRSNDSLLVKELDNQIREISVAASGLVAQGKVLGAKQMIVGTVSNVTVEEKKANNLKMLIGKKNATNTEYSATINFALQLTDIETGKVINQKSFNSKRDVVEAMRDIFNVGINNTREGAILAAIKSTRGLISSWINESYPPEIKILKIEDRDKSGYPQTILVSGIDATLQKGSKVVINEIEMFDAGNGKSLKRTKKMAELKVKEIQGDITVCTVTDGEKTLEEKMKSNVKMEFVLK